MKFGNIKEEHLVAGIFAIVFAVVVYFLNMLTGSSPEVAPEPQDYVDPCAMPVSITCEVVVERDFEECSDSTRIRSAIESLLANPEESDICKAQKLALDKRCAMGCRVDFSSLYQLAGDVELQFVTKGKERCVVSGKRTVSMRASCISDPNYQEPSPAQEQPAS